MTTVLVTGSNGFVGRAVVSTLISGGVPTRATVRDGRRRVLAGAQIYSGLDLEEVSGWSEALRGVDVIIHCAGRAHIAHEPRSTSLDQFRRVNVEGTRLLASRAAEFGVKRMILISSIGVNGSVTLGTPFTADDPVAPDSAYSRSKWESEIALREVSKGTGLESVIVRPPMVYGSEAPGNFGRLLRAVNHGIPLPFGAIENRRSLVALENLVHLLMVCVNHPAAAGETFLVSDDDDLSTPDLLRRMASALGRSLWLPRVPAPLIIAGARVLGHESSAVSVCASLQVSIAKTRTLLGWTPVVSVDDALRRSVLDYVASRRR
jgi:nucleoside-diphosphate-sugar epimerase